MRYSILGATAQQVKGVGGTDIREARGVGIIFATLTEQQVAKLKSQGCTLSKVGGVKAAVISAPVSPPIPIAGEAVYTPQWLVRYAGLEKLRPLFTPPLYGAGLTLAIIDTGIRESHELINGRVVYRKNFTSGPMRDGFDHGTGVASIALAVVPECGILNMKVLNDVGEGTEEEATLAINECILLHETQPEIAPLVINLSLGSDDDGNPNNPMRVACRAATELGILVVAAAGNAGPTPGTIMSPACERYVGAVGAAKPDPFGICGFSSRGPTKEGLIKPDAVMFGENISMASSASDTATTAKSGTSFAAPFGSGMIVLFEEGIIRQIMYTTRAGEQARVPVTEIFTAQVLLDEYSPGSCFKPQGEPAEKDNVYGYGLPVGDYILRALGAGLAVDVSALLLPMMAIMMMGVVIKSADLEP